MTLEFQKEVLQFLVQNKNVSKYINILDPKMFDTEIDYTIFGLLKSFYSTYGTQPSLANMLEHFDRQLKDAKTQIDADIRNLIQDNIKLAYEEFKGSADFIRDVLLQEYQIKLMKELFANSLQDLKDGNSEIVHSVFKEVSKIKQISEEDVEDENNRGRFALSEFSKGQRSLVEATPTYLKALNRMMATRGFYAPQLIAFMGAPKSFKTGTVLNICKGFVRDGKKVYYVDCENGEDRILDRFYQSMLEATWGEYVSGDLDDILEEMVVRYSSLKGDFRADYYPAHTKSMADVEDNLQYLEDEFGWKPDIIVYDYLDLMKPEDYKIKEKRLKIQAVYHDAIRLQKRRNIFGITLSQVNKDAVNKPIIDMTGFAEDFGKAANAHAAFALSRTLDEKEAGVMRITPVMQRDGVGSASKSACFVEVDEASMRITEISYEDWDERVKGAQEVSANGKSKRRVRKKNFKNLKDE